MNYSNVQTPKRGGRKATLSARNLRKISRRNANRIRTGSFLPNIPGSQSRRRLLANNPMVTRRVSVPQSQGSLMKITSPLQETRFGSSRIRHREPLGPLIGNIGFSLVQYSINPGIAATFPWLSTQASGYESYKINRCRLEFLTSAASTQTGVVAIAPDYDSADNPPTSLTQVEQMQNCYRGLSWVDGCCDLNPRGLGVLGPKRYVRTGVLASNQDIKTYDAATINIVTQGQASNGVQIGEIWIDYDITLSIPTNPKPGDEFLSGLLINAAGTGVTPANLLGTNPINEGPLAMSKVNDVVTVSNLVAGRQYVAMLQVFAATLTTNPTIVPDGVALVQVNALVSLINAGVYAIAVISFTATETQGTLTLGGLTVVTTPSESYLEVFGAITNPDV